MSFIQFFGSALQVTPHFHSLVPDGVFVPREGGVRFEPLPPPTQAEVERLLRVVRHRVLRLLEKRFACLRCGGRRRVLAYVKGAAGVRAILEHLGLPTASAHLTPAQGPPQSAWC